MYVVEGGTLGLLLIQMFLFYVIFTPKLASQIPYWCTMIIPFSACGSNLLKHLLFCQVSKLVRVEIFTE